MRLPNYSTFLAFLTWRTVAGSALPSPTFTSENETFIQSNSNGIGQFDQNTLNDVNRNATEVKGWLGLLLTDVKVEWNTGSAQGYSVGLGSARWTVLSDHPYYTLAALRPDQMYAAEVTHVDTDISHTLHFSTPALLAGDNLKDVMKTMMDTCSDEVKITEVSFSVKLEMEGTDRSGIVLEVVDISSSRPLQWMDVPPNASVAFLTGLPSSSFLNLTLKKIQSSDPLIFQDLLHRTVFTGGCIPFPASNFTRTLDLFLDLFPNKIGGSRWNVRCYADDEVFSGFPCHNSDMCVPLNWMCDKDEDCPDGDDEHDCGSTAYHSNSYCRKTEFRCVRRKQHVCLPISFLCDGRHDCTDGWDEDPRNCRRYYGRPGGVHYQGGSCRSSYFRCRNNLGCVAPKFVCDGEDDCADGSDEWNCGSDYDCDSYKEFQCFQSYGKERCIPRSWMCDDQDDCAHGEDEDFDVCRRVL